MNQLRNARRYAKVVHERLMEMNASPDNAASYLDAKASIDKVIELLTKLILDGGKYRQ
jgi:hypothetical protein